MGSRSATQLLQLPVRLHGIRLGRPVDVLLDSAAWRVLGFVVLCGDESLRFLAYAAAHTEDDEIAVPSALMLLEDVEFYRGRSRSLRALLGGVVGSGRRELGELQDVVVSPDGRVEGLVVEQGGETREIEPAGATVDFVPA
jgi:hypothetical protein